MSKTETKSKARERIVETAEGVRPVGIDRIIAEAEVAKMTLYNHFSSKDDLILAVLQYREEKVIEMFAVSIERHAKKGMNCLEAFFAALKDWFESPGFRGCSFINASVELADASHPASMFATKHKEKFHEMLKEITVEIVGAKPAKSLAPAIALMVEGAIVSAVMEQSSKSADVAKSAALALVANVNVK